jgi:hypothetical protein
METSSLLGLPISRLTGSNSRRLRTFVEDSVHSHLLKASPLSASSLSPFRPCTPTFDSQSLAVGRCCHPSTWGIGTDRAICLTYMDTQLYKVQTINLRTLPALSPCFRARFRTNGSQSELLGGDIYRLASPNERAHEKNSISGIRILRS